MDTPEIPHTEEEAHAPGWEALDTALAALYGDQEPTHFATRHTYRLGGPDPLDGISVYRAEAGGPHWHYVTYGFSDLYDKETEDPAVSGFGFELTFRLVRGPHEQAPPTWVCGLLQNLARYVFDSGQVFRPGHTLNCNGPIHLEADTLIHALVFAQDPQLSPIQTPHGSVAFVQLCGITQAEKDAVALWQVDRFLDLLAAENPTLVTDLQRPCHMQDPAFHQAVATGTRRDGSSLGGLYVAVLALKRSTHATLTIGATALCRFAHFIAGRLGHGKPFAFYGDALSVHFVPGEQGNNLHIEEGRVVLELTAATAQRLAEVLIPKAGTVRLPEFPHLVFEVQPSTIRDADGRVVEVIG